MSKFDEWNNLKKKISKKKCSIHFKQGDIYFVSIGYNIGAEIYGKSNDFLRPILIYRKISKISFIGIPLTTKQKNGNYYFSFEYKEGIQSVAILNQIRFYDSARLVYKSGYIKKDIFDLLKTKLSNFLNITPNINTRGGYTLQKEEQRISPFTKTKDILTKNNKNVNTSSVFIIAEAGVNHNGDINLAKKLIDVAVKAKADAVKFQTFKAEKLVSKNTKKAKYQQETTDKNESQFDMIKKLELDIDTHRELISYCEDKKIMFLSTPFDLDSIDLLNDLKLPIFKIPSGEITNLPYLEKIGALNKKVILSTGMSNIVEIEDALNILISNGTKKENITILHANTQYPTPMSDVNLRAMQTIGDTFDIAYGYSDHTLGIEVDIAAVAMGASIIEKHFTLDKTMDGPDHKASLEPNELMSMVQGIRNIELALGSSIKQPSASELPNIEIVRKSIVANVNIKKGEVFNKDNLAVKRAGNGISPMKWFEIIGSIANKDYKEDDRI